MTIILALDNDEGGYKSTFRFLKENINEVANAIPLTRQECEEALPLALEIITMDYRRLSTAELIDRLQDIDLGSVIPVPGERAVICQELKRRENLPEVPPGHLPHNSIIQAIKEKADIVEVLEKYTDVFLHQGKWTYRCTLHGPDNHPSGVIYPDQQRAWCYTCNQGGDVIDMVGLFTKTDKKASIKALADFYGINQTVMPLQENTAEKSDLSRFREALTEH